MEGRESPEEIEVTAAGEHTLAVRAVDVAGNALYFSRSPIPYPRAGAGQIFKHIGLYGYRRPFVRELASRPQTPLEIVESLEQLRALEHGFRICAVETQHDSIGVDSPGDLERVRRQLTVGSRG